MFEVYESAALLYFKLPIRKSPSPDANLKITVDSQPAPQSASREFDSLQERLILAIPVSLLGSLRFAILGATRHVVARRCFRISLKWRVLACEDFSRHKPKKALKAGKVTGPHSRPQL